MYLMLWILVGSVVGWLAGKSLEGNGYGRSVDLVMGAGGAAAGGLVMQAAGFSGYGGMVFAPSWQFAAPHFSLFLLHLRMAERFIRGLCDHYCSESLTFSI